MIIRFNRDSRRHKKKRGEKMTCDSTVGSALICSGVAAVVEFDKPKPDAPKSTVRQVDRSPRIIRPGGGDDEVGT